MTIKVLTIEELTAKMLSSAALEDAATQAQFLGAGWLRVTAQGEVEHIDTRLVQLHEGAPTDGGDGLGQWYDK